MRTDNIIQSSEHVAVLPHKTFLQQLTTSQDFNYRVQTYYPLKNEWLLGHYLKYVIHKHRVLVLGIIPYKKFIDRHHNSFSLQQEILTKIWSKQMSFSSTAIWKKSTFLKCPEKAFSGEVSTYNVFWKILDW